MARKLFVPLVIALLAISAVPAFAIDGGTPDGNAHPNVGLLAFDVDGPGGTPPFAICSGSVISDASFLTAAHCIIPPLVQLPPDVTWAVTLEAGSPSNPVVPGGTFPDDYPGCCVLTVPDSAIDYATSVAVDPLYDPATFGETGGAHDLAIVEFAPGTFADVTPVRIVGPGRLAHLGAAGSRLGPQLTLAGYGAELRDGAAYIAGYRKTGRASLVDVTSEWLVLTQSADALPRSGAPCVGDSGSPQFLGGSNVQVSVYHTAAACSGIGYAQRLDTPAEQAFLAPFIGP